MEIEKDRRKNGEESRVDGEIKECKRRRKRWIGRRDVGEGRAGDKDMKDEKEEMKEEEMKK